MKRTLHFVSMVLLSAGLVASLVACDSSSETGKADTTSIPDNQQEDDAALDTQLPPEDVNVQPDTNVSLDTFVEEDTAVIEPDTSVPEEDLVPQKPDYPAAPYGVIPGTVIKNHSFYDPQANATVKLSSLYKSGKKVLVISSAAEWCGACKQEAWALKSFYTEYAPQGLEIWYLLFEDKNSKPVDVASWQRWMNQINPNYPTLMDSDFQTGLYFQAAATPMNMVVDLSTMKITFLVTGYDEVGMENAVKKVLGL